ncbi:hypothetical protein SAMN04488588_0594 [Geotoga petraea]|uniref:YgjP-like metallopeptidase domain-containing protein n=1 Tax=Geotoga petraea TaxID=28234 RepID=A0A1G6JPP0_9BACT|nr:SprT family zinc-dependent metalloprotease [Geotoga petraea]SDC20657.1 hypothetical protein SAMN04488588_0594 [Geotoga petraea]
MIILISRIKIQNIEMDLLIKNITKKSLKIYVSEDKKLVIHKPKDYPMAKVKNFILKNEKNIIEEFNKEKEITNDFHFLGEEIDYAYKENSQVMNVDVKKLGNNLLVVYNKNLPENIKKEIIEKEQINFFYKELGDLILKYVEKHKIHIQKNINIIKIKNLKSRWGSCSSKNNLNFNIKLICFREEVIEYVVVHEMCHLVHMDHSKEFWRLVEKILPDYRVRKSELSKKIKIPELLK